MRPVVVQGYMFSSQNYFYKIFLVILKLNERHVLEGPGKISYELAKQKAETEYNKYKEIEKEQIHIEN